MMAGYNRDHTLNWYRQMTRKNAQKYKTTNLSDNKF